MDEIPEKIAETVKLPTFRKPSETNLLPRVPAVRAGQRPAVPFDRLLASNRPDGYTNGGG
jgi:hypothetical protein